MDRRYDYGSNALANSHTYTGRRLDPESGLYYYRNRYYHAQLGRFISRDPIGYRGSKWNMTWYSFIGVRDWTQGWFLPIKGECGLWTWDVANTLKDSDADNHRDIRIATVNRYQNPNPGHRENQNCIRIEFVNREGEVVVFYIDNGGVGGDDQVFTDEYRVLWPGDGEGNGMTVGTTTTILKPKWLSKEGCGCDAPEHAE